MIHFLMSMAYVLIYLSVVVFAMGILLLLTSLGHDAAELGAATVAIGAGIVLFLLAGAVYMLTVIAGKVVK
jgi:hypothetical protein